VDQGVVRRQMKVYEIKKKLSDLLDRYSNKTWEISYKTANA
jgi:hypothetical protein